MSSDSTGTVGRNPVDKEYAKWDHFDENAVEEVAPDSESDDDDAPPIVVKLKKAGALKADGNALFSMDAVDKASEKFADALAVMSELEDSKGVDIPCPSTSSEYQELWLECMKEKRKLQLPCYLNLALCLIKTKEWKGAAQAAAQAKRLDANNAKALFRHGLAIGMLDPNRLEEAKKDLLKAARLEPQNKQIRKELRLITEAVKDQKGKKPDTSVEEVEKLVGKVAFGPGLGLYADKKPESKTEKAQKTKDLVNKLCQDADKLRSGGKCKEAMDVYTQAMKAVLKMEDDTNVRTSDDTKVGTAPKQVGSKLELKLSIHVGAGECCMEMENFTRAEAEFDKASQVAEQVAATAQASEKKTKFGAVSKQLDQMAKQAWTLSQKTGQKTGE